MSTPVPGEIRCGRSRILSRNVIIESPPTRTAFAGTRFIIASAKAGISYARFAHLGKEGVLGRYAIHFHLVGDTMRGSQVQGAAIVDSHNRWITIHGTQYLVVRDCVGYKSVGHGYFLEDGTEVYNLLGSQFGACMPTGDGGCPIRCCRSIPTMGPGSGGPTDGTR